MTASHKSRTGPNTLGPHVLKSWNGKRLTVPQGGCTYAFDHEPMILTSELDLQLLTTMPYSGQKSFDSLTPHTHSWPVTLLGVPIM